MVRYPHEGYLRYLRHSGLNFAQAIEACKLSGLRAPESAYYENLDNVLREGRPSNFSLKNKPTQEYLKAHRMHDLVLDNRNGRMARAILSNSKLRRAVEFLLAAKGSPRKVLDDLALLEFPTGDFSIHSIYAYKASFFNLDEIGPEDWEAECKARYYGKDLFYVESGGREYALHKLGYREEIRPEDAISLILHESTMRFLETKNLPNTRDTSIAMKNYVDMVLAAIDEKRREGDSMTRVLARISKIDMMMVPSRTKPSLDDLARLDAEEDGASEGKDER